MTTAMRSANEDGSRPSAIDGTEGTWRPRIGRAWIVVLALGLGLVITQRGQAKPPGNGGGPAPPGTITYWQAVIDGWDAYLMLGDGSGKTSQPCPVIRNRAWEPPCDGGGVPSRLLHGGRRWFLSNHHVPGESAPYEGPGARRRDLFAISEAGSNVRLTFDPQLRILDGQTWAPDESGVAATISFLAARWAEDGSLVPGSGGIYTAVVLFSASGDVIGLAEPGPTFLVPVGLAGDVQFESPDSFVHDWSPDMTRIVTDRNRDVSDQRDLRVIDVATGVATTLVARSSACAAETLMQPEWSPDGGSIAFRATWPSCASADTVQVVAPDGSSRRTIVSETNGVGASSPRWSPDSAHVAYTRVVPATRRNPAVSDIYRVTLSSGAKANLTGDVAVQCRVPYWR